MVGTARAICGKESVTTFETRGGCHILIDPAKVVSEHKNWYPILSESLGEVDQAGDLMLPIPGCTQGGFVPRRIKNIP